MAAKRVLCVVSLARPFLHELAAPLFRMPVHLVVQVRVVHVARVCPCICVYCL
jgi:hypothetical protein